MQPSPTSERLFLFLLIGQVISILGSQIVRFAIIWYLVVETGSAQVLATLSFAVFFVYFISSPISGVLADRWNKKKIIGTVDFLQAVVTLLLIVLFSQGYNSYLFLVGMMTFRALFGSIHSPAFDTVIPLMVHEDSRNRMNSIRYFGNISTGIIGPIAGALLIESFPFVSVLWIDVVTFLIAIVPLILIPIPTVKEVLGSGELTSETREVEKEQLSFVAEFKEGLSTIRALGLFSLVMIFPLTNFLETPMNILLPLIIEFVYNGSARDFAIVGASFQATVAVVSLIFTKHNPFEKINPTKTIIFGLILIFVGKLVMIIPPPGSLGQLFAFLIVGIIIQGVGSPTVNINMQTLRQKVVPLDKYGRVHSISSALSLGGIPLATIFTGLFADVLGLRLIVFLASFTGLVVVVFIGGLPGFRRLGDRFMEKSADMADTLEVMVEVEAPPLGESITSD